VGVLEPVAGPTALSPLEVGVCPWCWLTQLADGPPELLEPAELANLAALSSTLRGEALASVDELIDRAALRRGSTVLELVSHANHLDQEFASRSLSIEVVEAQPSVAAALRARGNVVHAEVAEIIGARRRRGFDAVLDHYHAAHVPALGDYLASLAELLRPRGTICLEVDHLLPALEGGQLDAFRHGHYAYFSLRALVAALELHGLDAWDVVESPAYGGSVRVYAGHAGEARVAPGVQRLLASEDKAGLATIGRYRRFAVEARQRLAELREFLEQVRARGQSVIGYGAPSRATTLLTTARIGPELLPLLVDRSPAKQGRRLAGAGIPIGPVVEVERLKPDYLLILTWNLAAEVIDQMAAVRSWGGRFVTPLPRLEVLD
jgi:hypothetical protein